MTRGRPKGTKNKPKTDRVLVDSYIASIKVLAKVYEAKGETLIEAITNLKPEGLARGVTILAISHGDKREEKILPKLATTRLFATSPLVREIALKNTVARFTI